MAASRKSRFLTLIAIILVLAIGVGGAVYFQKTKPRPKRKPPVRSAPLVSVVPAVRSTQAVEIQAMGTVVPAQEIDLRSRVSGEIVAIHPDFQPGGLLAAGEVAVQLDARDYRLAVEAKKADRIRAEADLKLENGQQDVAKRAWELFPGKNGASERDQDLALRQPQQAKAQAAVEAAEANLKQAKLDLERTAVKVPFNAVVRTENADLGRQVSTQDALATLVGTDTFWVQVAVPVDRLSWIDIPQNSHAKGAAVRVAPGTPRERTGTVVRLLSDLETDGRMARILVAVQDPMGLQDKNGATQPLLLDEFVRVTISGRYIPNVVMLPRYALRDGNALWVLTGENTLEIRHPEILWRGAEEVFLGSGVSEGDRIIVSDLATPVSGMALRLDHTGNIEARPVAADAGEK